MGALGTRRGLGGLFGLFGLCGLCGRRIDDDEFLLLID